MVLDVLVYDQYSGMGGTFGTLRSRAWLSNAIRHVAKILAALKLYLPRQSKHPFSMKNKYQTPGSTVDCFGLIVSA